MTVLFASKKLDTDKMELIQRVKDDYATGEVSHEPAVGLPRNLRPVIPDATSQNLGWVGLQAFR